MCLTTRWAIILWISTGILPAPVAGKPIEATSASPALTRTSQAAGILVEAGRANLDLPPDAAGTPAVVIVASLATTAGPFPVSIKAQTLPDKPRSFVRTPVALVHLPDLNLPRPMPLPPLTSKFPPVDQTFHLMTQSGLATAPSSYRAIPARLRAVGRRIQIYVDTADSTTVDVGVLRDLVDAFDNRVWPLVAERFGAAADVNSDGRFTILMTRWLSRLGEGKTRVDGFVRGADFDRRQTTPFGNRADMMYLNAELKAGPHLRTVLAHEYTHAVTFSRKVLATDRPGPLDASAEEEGWLDEALAHLVEDEVGFSRSNLDYRISAFLTQPERYRLVVEDYFTADLFRSHGNRGATYLFLRWCVDRFGSGLLDTLIRSPKHGIANLEAATGTPFAELFRRWTIALYWSGIDPSSTDTNNYRSLNLRGELNDWILAGPRTTTIVPEGAAHGWTTEGTAAHFLVIERSPHQSVRVEIEGPPEANLQVTLLTLPPGLGRPDLVIRPAAELDGFVRVRARFHEAAGTPIRLGVLAWERVVPVADFHAASFRHAGLDMLGIASSFGSSLLPARGILRSRPIPLAGVRTSDGPLVFKAVGVDSQGRRVAAWAILEPTSRPDALAWDNDSF